MLIHDTLQKSGRVLINSAVSAAADAEQRFAELAMLRARSEIAPLGREKSEAFIARQNIAHYNELLGASKLDAAQRRSIEALLAEEEAKLGSK